MLPMTIFISTVKSNKNQAIGAYMKFKCRCLFKRLHTTCHFVILKTNFCFPVTVEFDNSFLI